jgi:hypothetical protein
MCLLQSYTTSQSSRSDEKDLSGVPDIDGHDFATHKNRLEAPGEYGSQNPKLVVRL